MSYHINITGTALTNVEEIIIPSGIQTSALPDQLVISGINGSLIDPRLGATTASDLNGTYIKTSSAIGSLGAAQAGTFNYYRVGAGAIPDGAFYFCAPLNLSVAGTESPKTFWTLGFASNPRINYLQNTAGTFTSVFPTSGWSVAAPDGDNDGYLGSINILNMQITATYPQTRVGGILGNFTQYPNLKKISMPSNAFRGNFPSIAGCTAIQEINVSDNELNGSFPSLATNTALKNINISNNEFTGSFPAITQLTLLEQINASGNGFTGSLPTLPASESLQSVDFSQNQFSGSPVPVNADTIVEDFETGLPAAYSAATSYALASGTWTAPASVLQQSTANAVSGIIACQIKSETGAFIQSPALPDGVGVIEMWAAASTSGSVRVEISTNGGTTFAQTGSVASVGTTSTRFSYVVNSESVTHVRFYRTSGTIRLDFVRITPNTVLASVNYGSNQLTGDIPTFLLSPLLTTADYSNNQLTGVAANFGVFSTLLTGYFQNNQLTQSAVNKILAAFVIAGGSGANRILDISGNAAPSTAGLADVQTLVTRGWNVIHA